MAYFFSDRPISDRRRRREMSRIAVPARETAPAAARPLLDAVEKKLGSVPNLFRLMAASPAVLDGYLAMSAALSRTLDLKLRERIALAVAAVNGCDYCMSAHTYLATNLAKLPVEEVARNRAGGSGEPKADAAVRLAAKIARERGHVADADLAEARLAGWTDAQIVEIVAVVAENVFTNFLNEVATTDIDFPVVRAAA
jgi:uncharacterized peroxidase-related enzyme